MNGAAASTCSKLSSTSSRCLAARKRSAAWSADSPESTTIASVLTIAAGTSSGRCSAASETKCAPSAKSARTARAASSARRVLPTPPGPVRVSSRTPSTRRRSTIARTSSSRPIVRFGDGGNPFAPPEPGDSEASGGKSGGRSPATSWKRCSGRSRSLSRCSPRSLSATSGGSSSATSSRVALEMSACPPCPAAQIRAARCTSNPT